MARDDSALYLVLAPEFGGTRFGHFEQMEVRLGSDPQRCHITLPEALGVAKEHCKVLRNPDNSLLVAPSERTAGVFVWKGDARRPTQIQTPTAVRSGDAFALVSPDGPKFFLEIGPLPASVLQARRSPSSGRKNLTAAKFAQEIRRRISATLYTFSPVAMAARAWYMIQSGMIWQPRFIIGGLVLLSGWMMAAPAGCAAWWYSDKTAAVEEKANTCEQDLAYVKQLGKTGIENYTFDQLADQVTAGNIGAALAKNDDLITAVKRKAQTLIGDVEPYAWIFDDTRDTVDDFVAFRTLVQKNDAIDPYTKELLPFLAATRNRTLGDWEKGLDSDEALVCGRGPARLTYRQAKRLGMVDVQLDAYVGNDVEAVANNEEDRWARLKKTALANLEPEPAVLMPSTIANLNQQASEGCIVADGDDDRANNGKLSKMLTAQIGREVDGLPEPENGKAAVARIAKLFAADRPEVSFVDKKTAPLSLLKPLNVALEGTPKKEWIIDRTAEVVARAMVLRCEAVLNKDAAKMEAIFGKLPNALPCLVLYYKLTKS